jgi:hypothetical protein
LRTKAPPSNRNVVFLTAEIDGDAVEVITVYD